ncbi:MAG: tRNA (adenosine(37)-N6)-threonylcarbamoyltransferase complex ATPase subunit type 1 TsaE [bacterium]|nr:tRNA (adenosine(37)-N6)-threonylcarbamoyltransferase complex ATPase subunit type 1 TsaE [bacterium]
MFISGFLSHSPSETESWAAEFAKKLKGGEIIALTGELGAGKTVIAKGIGRGLGVREEVLSPSFNYLLEYRGRLQLFHADLYRIDGPQAFRALGLDEYLDRGGVMLIEWAERVKDSLPPETIWIEIVPGEGDQERRISLRWKDA